MIGFPRYTVPCGGNDCTQVPKRIHLLQHLSVTNKKMKISQKGRGLGHVTYFFKFWDTPNISGTAKDTNLKFCMQIDLEGY